MLAVGSVVHVLVRNYDKATNPGATNELFRYVSLGRLKRLRRGLIRALGG